MKRLLSLAAGGVAALAVCAALASPAAAAPVAGGGDNKKGRQRAERALRDGEYESAERMFRELLAKDQRDALSRLGLSFALLKQRKNRDAFDHAARVIAVDPLSSRAHALLGSALLGGGDFRLSVEEFRTALSLDDDESLAVAGLGMVDFYENRLSAALVTLRRAVFLDPSEPDYLYSLGQVAARNERYKEAANAYERFLTIAPHTDADRRARIRGLIDFLRYLGTQSGLVQVAGPQRSDIPFELVNNRPIIKARVNGSKEELRLVVDTGAGMCVLSERVANRLGLRPVARGGQARAVGGGGRFEIVYGFLQSLTIGDPRVESAGVYARLENVPVYIRPFFNDQEPVDGYVGLSIISKYLASVDYATHTMTLLRDEARPRYDPAAPPAGIEIPIRTTSSGFWSGEIRVEGVEKPVNFIIDTGATISVVSEALAARENMERFAVRNRLRIYGAAGVTENVQLLLLPRLSFGAHDRKNVTAAVLDLEPINETSGFEQTGIVGGNVLRFFRVTFDFQRAVVRLEPIPSAPREDAPQTAVTNQP